MGVIFYIMGKSSSGKDTIYKRIIENKNISLKTVVGYTTRPIRNGEREDVEYRFVDEKKYEEMVKEGIVIESRRYNTIYGIWTYFTADDGQIDLENENYILIGTLESYEKVRSYYGKENVIPIYIEVEAGERLTRALEREKKQEKPKYAEMCRRYIADEEDFSEENIRRAEIETRYENDNLDSCIEKICDKILDTINKAG